MPQPDSSRQQTPRRHWPEGPWHGSPGQGGQWREPAPWPVDPEAPRAASRPLARPTPQPSKEEPGTDARTPDDRDGNEELARERGERPARKRGERDAQARSLEDVENEDTGRWVATERFTFDHELDDTLPQVPRYTDD